MSHQYAKKDVQPSRASHKRPSTEDQQQHPNVEHPDAQIIKLQRTVGNRAAQRLIAEGRVQPRRKKKSNNKPRTLPPVSGASQSQRVERQPAEEHDHFEQQEAPEYLIGADGGDFYASDHATQHIQTTAQPQIDRMQTPQKSKVQRGWLSSAWNKATSMGRGVLNAGKNLVSKEAEFAFKGALKVAGVSSKMVMGFLKKAGSAFINIIKNPVGFLRNLISGIKQGFGNFSSNITKHLKTGLFGWLFGTLSNAGMEVPKSFDMKSILSMVMQVMGVTANALKMRLAKFIGEKNMAHIEKAQSILSTLMTGGIGGLWKQIAQYVGNLKDMVMGEIRNWVITRVIQSAVIKLLSMFNPASAIVSAIQMIYKVIRFFMERGKQIMGLFQAIAGSVAAIVAGNVSKLAQKIEQVLARAIPVVIGFMASLLGLGGIANKIKAIIAKVRKPVDKAIDKVLKKIVGTVKKIMPGKKGKAASKSTDKKKQGKINAGIAAINAEEKQYLTNGKISQEEAKKVAKTVKKKHPVFAKLNVKDAGTKWNYQYVSRKVDEIEGEDKEETGGAKAENYETVKSLLNQQVDSDPPPKLPTGYHYRHNENNVIIAIVRNDANDKKFQALGVNDDGQIVLGNHTRKRLSNPTEMKKNMPPQANHQTHHIIPDNVARSHPLVIAARERGNPSWNVDNKANLINLPSTYAEYEKKGRGQRLPMHEGSHPKWDREAVSVLTQEQEKLIKNEGKPLEEIAPEKITKAVLNAEIRLRMRLRTWAMVSIGNRKRIDATIKKRLGR